MMGKLAVGESEEDVRRAILDTLITGMSVLTPSTDEL